MKKGFTLIELLIVVAIIAILAAIAVPNFLEAQTRSKVARSKADMRSLSVAVESYVVDYNRMYWDGDDDNGIPRSTVCAELNKASDIFPACLPTSAPSDGTGRAYNNCVYRVWHFYTTPIAYITGIPIEPYSQFIPYHITDEHTTDNQPAFGEIYSCGPDKTVGYGSQNPSDAGTQNFGVIGGVPSSGSFSNGVGAGAGQPWQFNDIYDPTNGTISYGDVYRVCAVRDIDTFYQRLGSGFPLQSP